MAKVFNMIRENYPSLWIVLSTRYSIEVPGFIHIKWNDDLRKITKYMVANIDESLGKMEDVSS